MNMLTRAAYEALIEEDKVELRRSAINQPEKRHIEDVLDWSVEYLYPQAVISEPLQEAFGLKGMPGVTAPKVDLADTIGATAPPARYNKDGERECIDLMRDLLGDEGFVAYCRGQVLKYTYRTGLKDAPEQDTAKAKFYSDMALHVLAPYAYDDPRTYRAGHQGYVRQDFEFPTHELLQATFNPKVSRNPHGAGMIRGGMNVSVKGYKGVAFFVRSCRKGRAKVVMVGDNTVHDVPEDFCTKLAGRQFCRECGQIGCAHDGRS